MARDGRAFLNGFEQVIMTFLVAFVLGYVLNRAWGFLNE
jgi:predicted PurR-regulated permease PerM